MLMDFYSFACYECKVRMTDLQIKAETFCKTAGLSVLSDFADATHHVTT